MLNREDHYLLGVPVDHIINKVAVSGCYELADAFGILGSTNLPEKASDSEESAVLHL
jgi:hypothetical protein